MYYHKRTAHSEKKTEYSEFNGACVCGETCTSKAKFNQHLDDYHRKWNGRYHCYNCKRSYSDRSKLKIHFEKFHQLKTRRKYTKTLDEFDLNINLEDLEFDENFEYLFLEIWAFVCVLAFYSEIELFNIFIYSTLVRLAIGTFFRPVFLQVLIKF